MDTQDTLDFLRAIGSMPVECVAGAVPVTRRKVYLLRRDQPFDWLNLLQELGMLADPAHLCPRESLGHHQHVLMLHLKSGDLSLAPKARRCGNTIC